MIIFCLAALPACHAFHMNESVVVSYVAHPISNACTLLHKTSKSSSDSEL